MKKTIDIVTTVIIVLLVLLVAVLYAPSIFGIKTFSVLSGSMEPEIHVGSVIYVTRVSDGIFTTGEIITFYDARGTVVTHRINEITDGGKIVTKGDANETPDSPIDSDQIIGKVSFCIPYLGYCAVWISTFYGKAVLIGLIAVSLLLLTISDVLSKKNKDDRANKTY